MDQKPKENIFRDEEEIRVLERRLQLLRDLAKQEAAKEAPMTREAAEGGAKGELPSGAPPPSDDAQQVAPLAPHYHDTKVSELKTYETNRQLKALVEIAFERSLYDAIDIARRLDDAHLLDAFHDSLVDELHEKLVEAGKLEEM